MCSLPPGVAALVFQDLPGFLRFPGALPSSSAVGYRPESFPTLTSTFFPHISSDFGGALSLLLLPHQSTFLKIPDRSSIVLYAHAGAALASPTGLLRLPPFRCSGAVFSGASSAPAPPL
eukprot:CAMPEP_0178477268 /NCGR_PEP_ID=MMETSP0696-20121128/4046_1 /TAXON_ID=265572 /ORGANISM="Extubocellulus spinifer, Strain CCMP396" /LENGTH=118 /DNA_ID=CAMNT_0020104579 /DNA_START=61 /DNA_END=416 /DNA_ORIENTATION=+